MTDPAVAFSVNVRGLGMALLVAKRRTPLVATRTTAATNAAALYLSSAA
jgi:hypothetical protein